MAEFADIEQLKEAVMDLATRGAGPLTQKEARAALGCSVAIAFTQLFREGRLILATATLHIPAEAGFTGDKARTFCGRMIHAVNLQGAYAADQRPICRICESALFRQ